MQFFNKAFFYGAAAAAIGMLIGTGIFVLLAGFAVSKLIFLLLSIALYVIVFVRYWKLETEAKRVGLMTRAEHRTELRHEAELQSIWESK